MVTHRTAATDLRHLGVKFVSKYDRNVLGGKLVHQHHIRPPVRSRTRARHQTRVPFRWTGTSMALGTTSILNTRRLRLSGFFLVACRFSARQAKREQDYEEYE